MLGIGLRCALPYRLLQLCCQLVSPGWRLYLLLGLLLLAQAATGAGKPHGCLLCRQTLGVPKWWC